MYILYLGETSLYVRVDGVLKCAVRHGDILRGAAFRVAA